MLFALSISIMYLIIYTHGTKHIRSPTSYSTNREFFETRCMLHKHCAHSRPRPCAYARTFFPRAALRIQVRYIGTYGTERSLFMSERFIESENAIVAIKRAKTFYSRGSRIYIYICILCCFYAGLAGFLNATLNRIT